MKKVICVMLSTVMVMGSVATSFAGTVSSDVSDVIEKDVAFMERLFDCEDNIVKIDNNVYEMEVELAGIPVHFTEEKISDDVYQLTILEDGKEDILLIDASNGQITRDGITTDGATTDLVTPRAIINWHYADTPFASKASDYTKLDKTVTHTVKYGSVIMDLGVGVITTYIAVKLSLSGAYAYAPLTTGIIGEAANQIKRAASPYVMESKVKETTYRIPSDKEQRRKHNVIYYDTENKAVNSSTHYSMFF